MKIPAIIKAEALITSLVLNLDPASKHNYLAFNQVTRLGGSKKFN